MHVRLEGKFVGIPNEYETSNIIPDLTIKTVLLPPTLNTYPYKPFQLGGKSSPYEIHVCLLVGEEGFYFKGSKKRGTESVDETFVPYKDFPGSKLAALIDVGTITFDCVLHFEKAEDAKPKVSEAVRFVEQFKWPV